MEMLSLFHDLGTVYFSCAIESTTLTLIALLLLSLSVWLFTLNITYPVFIDTEGAGGNGRADSLDTATRSLVCQAFCETIRSADLQAGIYASKNWFNNNLDITKFSADNVIWLAAYNDEPTYGGTFQMWQYTSSGRINGIEGRVDFNLSYLDKSVTSDADTSEEEKEEKNPEEPDDGSKQKNNPEKENEDGQNNRRDM